MAVGRTVPIDGAPIERIVGWTDTDVNAHMRSPAYLEMANDRRMLAFHEAGWPLARFHEEGLGPVLLEESLQFRRELLMNTRATVDLQLAGLSLDGSRWRLRCTVRRADGKVAAVVSGTGGWDDLAQRRLVVPPPGLDDLLVPLERTDDFEVLPSLLPRA
jgi:acyl-CoA thioester hydrolase